MKRIICFFMALTVFCLSLAGCSQSDEQMPDGKSASTDTILSADVNSEITQDGLEIILELPTAHRRWMPTIKNHLYQRKARREL